MLCYLLPEMARLLFFRSDSVLFALPSAVVTIGYTRELHNHSNLNILVIKKLHAELVFRCCFLLGLVFASNKSHLLRQIAIQECVLTFQTVYCPDRLMTTGEGRVSSSFHRKTRICQLEEVSP